MHLIVGIFDCKTRIKAGPSVIDIFENKITAGPVSLVQILVPGVIHLFFICIRIDYRVSIRIKLKIGMGIKPIIGLKELPINNLRILLALLPVFFVVITGT